MENIIQIDNLKKSFGEVKAVNDISFRVKQGELFAFLGENGAGKSTTISILCGTLRKDSGTVLVDGVNIDGNTDAVKCKLGVVFQNAVSDSALSVKDNLRSRAALYNIHGKEFEARIKELDRLLGIKEFYKRAVGKLSGGQRRRVDIARALINRPKILILDEPTTGLDPQTRKTVWNVLDFLRKQSGMTVFLTTHYMEEAAEADYVVILDHGKISAKGTPIELKNNYTGDFITLYGVSEEQAARLGTPEKVVGGYRIAVKSTQEATALVLKYSELFQDYEITKGKMDDVFLAVTGKRLEGSV